MVADWASGWEVASWIPLSPAASRRSLPTCAALESKCCYFSTDRPTSKLAARMVLAAAPSYCAVWHYGSNPVKPNTIVRPRHHPAIRYHQYCRPYNLCFSSGIKSV
ncbi:hypothetical protein BC830DRAFT_757559 [Chytriomyces sp. MP71]|nr:hypothetical protein BC830DRAFT_757559 [Chytriomyces sp. MP71]